jgi:hypothetical protein
MPVSRYEMRPGTELRSVRRVHPSRESVYLLVNLEGVDQVGVHVLRGIHFAEPPVGAWLSAAGATASWSATIQRDL